MLSNCGVGEDSWESRGQQGDQTSQSYRKSTLNIHCKDWCWSWSSNTLATWCEEPTHWNKLWCWERLKTGGEGDNRGWDGWTTSQFRWTWVWASSGRLWRAGKSGMLQSLGSQKVRHDWVSEQQQMTMSFAATCMDLEIIILSKMSQKEKDKYHMISFICGI